MCTVIISMNSGYNIVFDNLDNTGNILFFVSRIFSEGGGGGGVTLHIAFLVSRMSLIPINLSQIFCSVPVDCFENGILLYLWESSD